MSSQPYLNDIQRVLGRALSRLDAEITSRTRGSFDRTWWCWKFVDFSAPRFQEGAYTLAWLATSPFAPGGARDSARLVDQAQAAIRFWTTLQHADGSFDEAYPFERSLAATAFTGFYVGCAVERLAGRLDSAVEGAARTALERGADWLARNGEYHGVLSNHLAAAAAALQVASDLLGTDRFRSARDRYLGIVYREQDAAEGWYREYSGADPGYQSHGMFYLAEIWRRTLDPALLESLRRASDFMAWFVHPDGTIGGEYASRGTKFAYPAGFEILAGEIPSAAAIARHLRVRVAEGRCIGPYEADAWNLSPLLNNHLFAAEAALAPLPHAALPWESEGATAVFPNAGLVVARRADRLMVASPGRGGAVKLWEIPSGRLLYEDCGYAQLFGKGAYATQFPSEWRRRQDEPLEVQLVAPFRSVPRIRFSPVRFVAFRAFTLTVGRLPTIARLLKQALVTVLVRKQSDAPGRLSRSIGFSEDGALSIVDELSGLAAEPVPLDRHVPVHMGSARYADYVDWLGATHVCPPPLASGSGTAARRVTVEAWPDTARDHPSA